MTDIDHAAQAAVPTLAGIRWLSDPALMFMLCFCGMSTGLAIDLQAISPVALASLCLGTHSLADSIVTHAGVLPATNLLMLAGGMVAAGVAVPDAGRRSVRRFGSYAGCELAMLAGMFLAEWFGPRLVASVDLPWDLSSMVAVMVVGMALGMVAFTALGRLRRLSRS